MSEWDSAPVASEVMTVRQEWIDYNGHLNMAYYNVLFDMAVDAVFDRIGLGPSYVKARSASFFTAEAHVCYVRELAAGTPVVATFQLIGLDEKRAHFFQELRHAEEGWLSATCEQLSLHVDMAARKVAPWPQDILANLKTLETAHSGLSVPERAGRRIQIPSKPS